MNVDELKQLCREGESVLLYMPAPNSQGYTRRLLGCRGPRGVVINGTERGQTVQFDSRAVLRCLKRIDKEADDADE